MSVQSAAELLKIQPIFSPSLGMQIAILYRHVLRVASDIHVYTKFWEVISDRSADAWFVFRVCCVGITANDTKKFKRT